MLLPTKNAHNSLGLLHPGEELEGLGQLSSVEGLWFTENTCSVTQTSSYRIWQKVVHSNKIFFVGKQGWIEYFYMDPKVNFLPPERVISLPSLGMKHWCFDPTFSSQSNNTNSLMSSTSKPDSFTRLFRMFCKGRDCRFLHIDWIYIHIFTYRFYT